MLNLVTLQYRDIYPDGSGKFHANCPSCQPIASSVYRKGNQPPLPIHPTMPLFQCKCYYVTMSLGNQNAPVTHTHQDMVSDLTSFGPWLSNMEHQLSTLAQTILDLKTQCEST